MAFLGPSLRRKRVTDRPAARVATAALISLALNAVLLLAVARLGAFDLTKPIEPTRVALESLSADKWEANRAIAGAPRVPALPVPPRTEPQPQPVPEVKPPSEQQPKGQVVDVAPSPDSRPPESSRFLSDRDNRVEKETRSRWAGTDVFKNRAPAPVKGGEGKRQEAGDGGNDKETREAKAGQGGSSGMPAVAKNEASAPKPRPPGGDERLAMLEKRPSPGRLAPGGEPAPEEGNGGQRTPGLPGEHQEGQKKLGDPRLLPSVESMSRITAGPSADYIDKDIEEGDFTALNTRAFKFAGFFNRFKQDLSEHWIPAIRYNHGARDPNGSVYGSEDRVTELHIVLDASGAVKDVKVIQPSGLEFLDRVAVKSVREASPYYNIPAGLLDAKGELAFDFGFIVEGNRGVPIRPRYHPGL